LAIEFIAKDYGMIAGRVLQYPAYGKGALEELFGVFIMVAVIKYAPDVGLRICFPDHVTQRDPFPQAHAKGFTHVIAAHDLEKPY